jgi:hypothetical protein
MILRLIPVAASASLNAQRRASAIAMLAQIAGEPAYARALARLPQEQVGRLVQAIAENALRDLEAPLQNLLSRLIRAEHPDLADFRARLDAEIGRRIVTGVAVRFDHMPDIENPDRHPDLV